MRYLCTLVLSITWLFLSSCATQSKTKTPDSPVYEAALKNIDAALYDTTEIDVEGTHFFIFIRKVRPIKSDWITEAVKIYWPKLTVQLGRGVKEAALIDFDVPFGGGPFERYVIGIFSSSSVSDEFKKIVQQATGWSEKNSTADYIKFHYQDFADPQKAYVEDLVVHELAHLFFGFGKTTAPQQKLDLWFPLGLGIVYDRMAWSQVHQSLSPAFLGVTAEWRRYAKLPVDQRLVGPDVTRDQQFDLNRIQVFGHGKSSVFLETLRQKMGSNNFDRIVKQMIETGVECNYMEFKKLASVKEQKIIKNLERSFKVL